MRLRRIALVLVTLCVVLTLTACSTVPITGRTRLMLTSVETENQMGVQAYTDIISKSKISTHPEANAILRRVVSRIAPLANVEGAEWECKLIESNQVNAFALPGGKVAVYTGILSVCDTEAGLAAVIGHEIGHVIARHGGERMSLGLAVQLVLTGSSVAMKDMDPKTSALILGALGVGANLGVMLPYSRKHEYESDYIGIRLMARAGYDPSEAPRLWQRMAAKSKGAPPEILSTHPASDRRSAALAEMLPEMKQIYAGAPKRYGLGVKLPMIRAAK